MYVYDVPGLVPVMAQDGPMTCWATVYAMMLSWRKSTVFAPRDAVGQVAPRYATLYDAGLTTQSSPRGLPSAEWLPFLRAAKMNFQPLKNLTIDAWLELLQTYGILWVGSLYSLSQGAGLHSRIIVSMIKGDDASDTKFGIIDPAYGRKYMEPFTTFLAKYEGAMTEAGDSYLQIRHF